MFKASGVQEGERVIVLSQHDTALLSCLDFLQFSL